MNVKRNQFSAVQRWFNRTYRAWKCKSDINP